MSAGQFFAITRGRRFETGCRQVNFFICDPQNIIVSDIKDKIAVLSKNIVCQSSIYIGGVAQMVERSLSMREVPGSIPGASSTFLQFLNYIVHMKQYCIMG